MSAVFRFFVLKLGPHFQDFDTLRSKLYEKIRQAPSSPFTFVAVIENLIFGIIKYICFDALTKIFLPNPKLSYIMFLVMSELSIRTISLNFPQSSRKCVIKMTLGPYDIDNAVVPEIKKKNDLRGKNVRW